VDESNDSDSAEVNPFELDNSESNDDDIAEFDLDSLLDDDDNQINK